jgi:hypothetical protein
MKIYVSLTTIPARIKNINGCINSLLNQTRKPDQIFINVPTKYKRFVETINDEDLALITAPNVKIVRCIDYGPGTKLLGSYKLLDNDSMLVIVDDDMIYKNYMIETMYQAFMANPNQAYSFCVDIFGGVPVGKGADGFAINTSSLSKLDIFYEYIQNDKYLFYHDDYWISHYLHAIGVPVKTLKHKLRADHGPLIYNIYNDTNGLVRLNGEFSRHRVETYCHSYFSKNANDIKQLLENI